jgi:hypothetical protein
MIESDARNHEQLHGGDLRRVVAKEDEVGAAPAAVILCGCDGRRRYYRAQVVELGGESGR